MAGVDRHDLQRKKEAHAPDPAPAGDEQRYQFHHPQDQQCAGLSGGLPAADGLSQKRKAVEEASRPYHASHNLIHVT